jgi:heme-degrading monooxygenase HmoA
VGAPEVAGPPEGPEVIHRDVRLRARFVPPRTFALTTRWETEADAYRFAHTPEHLAFWRWGSVPGNTRGGWLVVYRYERGDRCGGTGRR